MIQQKTLAACPAKIAVIGRAEDTANYENALHAMGAECVTTMDIGCLPEFNGMILPGGGDIAPAFFGQKNQGSKNIDIELDITQFQALDLFVKWKRPVFGICKGMQIINVCLGGTITQHIRETALHAWENGDKLHDTHTQPGSFLDKLYGKRLLTNSAHHQAIAALGRDLTIVQHADDGIVEGIVHNTLPIFGVQWHPERLFPDFISRMPATPVPADGRILFGYYLSLCAPEPLIP